MTLRVGLTFRFGRLRGLHNAADTRMTPAFGQAVSNRLPLANAVVYRPELA